MVVKSGHTGRQRRRAPWVAYLWPGLPHLWIRGSWAGLILAVGFTALLHTTVLGTLVWPEWLPPRVLLGCGGTLGLLWIAALWETRGELRRLAAERQDAERQGVGREGDHAGHQDGEEIEGDETAERGHPNQLLVDQHSDEPNTDAPFIEAQTHYLRADWAAAERLLLTIVRKDRDDAEAGLLLATIWRRIGRTAEARRRLKQLARREAAEPWRFEIDAELALCNAAEALCDATETQPGEAPQDESADDLAEPSPHDGRAAVRSERPAEVDPAGALGTDRNAA
ncbi:MAG: hypothetical protein AAGG46_10965 [Planctomycetota bacterium]